MSVIPRIRLAAAGLSLALCLTTPDLASAQVVTMYGAEFDFDGHFSRVEVGSGSLTPITANNGGFYAGMDFDPTTGILWACSGSFLYTVNPATGRPLTTRTIGGSGGNIYNLSFAPDGSLYGLGNGDGNLYRVDKATATATFLGTSSQGMFALEFGPAGVLYGAGFHLYQIDTSNGAATDLGNLAGGATALFTDLDFAPDGVMYGVTSLTTSDSLYRIDLPGAKAVLIGITGGDLKSIASVPEPDSLVLLTLGSLGLFVYKRAARGRKMAT